jgi:cytochrome c-type biogenesis protein CcmH
VKIVALLLGLSLLAPVYAAQVEEDPLERQMLEIARDLRCAVCQNQPISESNADLARDMRDIIREQLKAGKSRAEIMQYFVDRYGNYVLMKPPVSGPGTLLWLLPVLIGAILALSAFIYLQHRRRVAPTPAPKLSKQDAARVHAARDNENA